MMNNANFWIYLLTCSLITYLIRMIPLVLFKKKIKNRFLLSFLYYIPYAVLAVMTIPAIFYSTSYKTSALAGFIVAVLLAYKEKSLLIVAFASCVMVFVTEFIIKLI